MKIPGINVQWPWSELIAKGEKLVETRNYPLPKKYLGTDLALIETPGPKGKNHGIAKAQIIAIVRFSECYEYRDLDHWISENNLHLVSQDGGPLCYQVGKHGWVVERVIQLHPPVPAPARKGIVFALECEIPYADFSET